MNTLDIIRGNLERAIYDLSVCKSLLTNHAPVAAFTSAGADSVEAELKRRVRHKRLGRRAPTNGKAFVRSYHQRLNISKGIKAAYARKRAKGEPLVKGAKRGDSSGAK